MTIPQRLKKVSVLFSYLFVLTGIVILMGWVMDITFFKSIDKNWISFKVNTAIWLILSGFALLLLNKNRNTSSVKNSISILSSIVFLMSLLTILEYSIGFNTGVDEFFFKASATGEGISNPGRPVAVSALCFLFFSVTLLPGIRNSGKIYLIQSLYFLIGVIAFLCGTGYVLGIYSVDGLKGYAYLSIFSGVSFFVMMLAGLFSRPDKGLMLQISSDTVGGNLFRKTFFFFFPGLIVLAWIRLLGELAGLYSKEISVVILVMIALISFTFILYSSTSSLIASEKEISKNEEQLTEANAGFEKAEELAGLGSWIIDIRSGKRTKKWSKQMFRLFGLEIASSPPSFAEYLKLIHPDDREKVKNIYFQLSNGELPHSLVYRTNPTHLPVKYLLPTLYIERDKQGEPDVCYGTIQDITERVLAEQKIKEREELFSKAFHSKVFGLAIVNKDRRIIDINETLTTLIGFSREDFLGKTSAEIGIVNPEYIRKRDEILLLVFNNGRVDNYELEIVTRHGKAITLLLSVEPLELNNEPHWLIYLFNVTEKRIAEKLLEESEIRLRSILNTVPECVKIIDHNGELTYMNPAGLAMMEADDFEMVKGRNGLKNIHEIYLKEFYRLVTTVFSGEPGKMEYEITGLKGTHRWMETHMVSLRNGGNKINSILGVTRDITDRKNSEKIIKDAHRRLLFHIDNAPLGYIEWDGDFKIKTWSAKAVEIFGWSLEEVQDRQEKGLSLIHEDDFIAAKKTDLLLQNGEITTNHFIYRSYSKSGKIIWCEWFDSVLKNEEGKVEAIMSLVQDVTERKNIENELWDNRERLSRAEKMGDLGHGYYDFHNGKMYLSEGLYNIFGVAAETFSHTFQGLKSVIYPGDKLIQEQAIDKLIDEGEVEVEFRIQRPSGEIRNVLFKTLMKKNEKGDYINSFTTAICVTESRQKEEKIKTYNFQLKQLAGNLQNSREEERRRIGREIHDELGQWLTVLKMEVSRVKKIKGDEKQLDASVAEMLNQIDGCIKSSRRISTDLRPTIIDDLGLVATIEWQSEEFGKRYKIKSAFKTDINEIDLPSDYTIGIFRIFQESLTNIARHAEASSIISSLFIEENNLVLKIADDGKGFDTSKIGSNQTLGLIGMKERTLLMNGTYTINSSEAGTNIKVSIPLIAQ